MNDYNKPPLGADPATIHAESRAKDLADTNTDTSRTPCSIIKHCCKFNGFMCEYANENGYCRLTACAYPNIAKTRILKESEVDE